MRIQTIAAFACVAAAAGQPAAAQTPGQPADVAPAISFPPIYFERGSTEIPATMLPILDGLVATAASRRPRFTLTGHADRVGSADLNMRLSLARVERVRRYLVSRGIAGSCIQAEAMGESRPAVETADGVEEPQNRRVEVSAEAGCTN